MKTDVFVSVVAPLKDDGAIVADFVREVSAMLQEHFSNYEVVLVDDHSTDATTATVAGLLREIACVRYIRLSRQFGQEIAITAGLDSCIGDYVVVMLPETDPPGLVPELVERCRAGAGVLTGVSDTPQPKTRSERLLSRAFHWYTRRFLGTDLIAGASHFQVFSRQAVNAITQIHDRYRTMRLFAAVIGYQAQAFTYHPLSRAGRVRTASLLDHVQTAVAVISASSLHPLRVVSLTGLAASGLNLLYMLYVALVRLWKTDVAPGWTTLSLQQGFMFFLLFALVAILSEYVGRILEESLGRPLYWVQDELHSSVLLSDATRRNVLYESERRPCP